MPDFPPLPIGAALELPYVRQHARWLWDGARDLEIQDFCEPEVLDGDWRALANDIRQELAGYPGRIGLHGPFYGLEIGAKDPRVRAVVMDRLRQGLDIAGVVGATQMVIHSPFDAWDHHNALDAAGREGRIHRVRDWLAPFVAEARQVGVALVLENIQDRDASHRVDLARALGEGVGVSLDTGHANYAHHATGAPPVVSYVTAAGSLLAHVHLQDTDGYADRHWHPGEGNIPWADVFAEIAGLGGAPRLVLEVAEMADLMIGFDHLVAAGLAR
jgi:sugar phosphate isomerase/epimerase